jgi:hypothetical protein
MEQHSATSARRAVCWEWLRLWHLAGAHAEVLAGTTELSSQSSVGGLSANLEDESGVDEYSRLQFDSRREAGVVEGLAVST